MFQLSQPEITDEDITSVVTALREGWVSTSSPGVAKFSRSFSQRLGVNHALAVNSGTSALHLALLAAGVTERDLVIAPTLTFVAPINTIKYIGAEPIFIGYNKYLTIDVRSLATFVRSQLDFDGRQAIHRESGRKVSAIILVHTFGTVCDIESIKRICDPVNIKIIEDATEALGSRYIYSDSVTRYAGTLSSFGCFSFNGNKLITAGAGGMVVTSDSHSYEIMRHLASQAKADPIFYEHDKVGYNYMMAAVNSALVGSQFSRLDSILKKKRTIHETYVRLTKGIESFAVLESPPNCVSSYWLNTIIIPRVSTQAQQKEFIDHMQTVGISVRPIWRLNHLQSQYKQCYYYHLDRSSDEGNYSINSYFNVPSDTRLTYSNLENICTMIHNYAEEK